MRDGMNHLGEAFGAPASVEDILKHMERVIVGKQEVLRQLMAALLSEGHVLIEDVPGVGKTQMVATLSRTVSGKFNRIQFTPDVMPSDITGFSMFHPGNREFEYREGVAMCNFLLADEINRASPKTQSSLLEIMEEGQITVDGKTYALPKPFCVLATQNPIESFGTFPLPEAQMDRFFIKLAIGYPSREQEKTIIDRFGQSNPLEALTAIASPEDLIALQQQAKQIRMEDTLKAYIVELVEKTRTHPLVSLGVSPRGSLHLYRAAKAWAMMQDRSYVIPDDIQAMCVPVLAHRIVMHASARMKGVSGEDVVREAVTALKVTMV
jgi:MoxR-like ATPase